ncbi:MAG: HAMP domain-containing histidine kinase [Patescibacteria group bacterium]|nr:HAMP domain-containing histidine kinase [Patescibacteria group bacterium]
MNEIEELKLENEKLKNNNTVKSDLISISAHQLRTSLSAIKWTLKMFIDGDLGELTAEQKDFIQKTFDSNERMIILVNDLLIINHTDDINVKLDLKEIDILELLEQTLSEFYGEARKKHVKINFTKPQTSIPLINCDKRMIRIVFQNLIENSIKYSKQDDTVSIHIEYDNTTNSINMSVHDNGIGIKEEDKSKIFSKFYRAENAIKKDYSGSGLGLFATKSIVLRHKGEIWFESDNDSGTTFFVRLPII